MTQPNSYEVPVIFSCHDSQLVGIVHHGAVDVKRGVLIIVGGPQYRVGSHRQFLLLARGLAAQGIPVFRFDCRGMGDSEGGFQGFDALDDDLGIAINVFCKEVPSLEEVVIWGLCDGASAACFYAVQDERVIGLCLANPWVRTEQGEAKAFLKHYYLSRLCNGEVWKKLLSGELEIFKAIVGFVTNLKRSRNTRKGRKQLNDRLTPDLQQLSLPAKVFRDLELFSGKVIFFISGNDLTAAEFMDSVDKDRRRQKLMNSNRVSLVRFAGADHTFSRRDWMHDVISQTASWVKSL